MDAFRASNGSSAKIEYVERVLGFLYEQGFARKFEEVGSPPEDLDVWYKNARVYEIVTQRRTPTPLERFYLVTLIESIRLEAMAPPMPGGLHEFDVSAYEFSEDILAFKQAVIDEILQQEALSPSSLSEP